VTAITTPDVPSFGATHRLRALWTPARARLWLVACAIAAWLPVFGVPFRGWLDFSAFYAAGKLAFTPDVSRIAPIVQLQAEQGLPITPFVYPPGVALAYLPFAALPYDFAAVLHLGLMLALVVGAIVLGAEALRLPRRWATVGGLAWAPAAAGVLTGQNTALALMVTVLLAIALTAGHEGRAGAAAGLLAYKPQLGAPLIGLLVLRNRWRALGAVMGVIALQYLAGVVATGGNHGWPFDWLATVQAYSIEDFQANGWQAISLPAVGHQLERLTGLPGLTLAGWILGLAVVVRCIPAMRRLPVLEAVALACACGLVVSPHAWVYDATLLLPALGVLAARAANRGWPWEARWLLAGSFAMVLCWPLGGLVGLTLVPLVVVLVPLALLRSSDQAVARARVGSLPLGQ
jgi:hypothetical protein